MQTRELGIKARWQTPQTYLVALQVMHLCKKQSFLEEQWGWVKFLRGRDLGKGEAEIYIVMRVAVDKVLRFEFEATGSNL